MFAFKALILTIIFGALAYVFGYFYASKIFDGRPENVTNTFRKLTGIRFADIMITLCIVAQIIVYISEKY